MPLFLTESYHKGIDDLISTFRENCKDPAYVQEVDEIIAADKEVRDGCKVVTYKTVEDVSLDAFVYLPEGHRVGDRRPAVAFFHGGGWDVGKPEWGRMQCEHFASLGMVAVSFEYRLYTQHDATPVQGIADAKSALRWMRSNAGELGIDTDRIAASGFSAGGHLALCAAMLDTFDEPGEDLTVSAKPNAFLLWVTPAKIFESNWFKRILKGQAEVADCDPFLHVRPGLPPAVMFQGTIDSDVPPWTARAFAQKMRDAGNRCDLHMYEGQTHLNWGDNAFDVLEEMDAFLESIGFMRP
jgi:acetyl esterase/lipase